MTTFKLVVEEFQVHAPTSWGDADAERVYPRIDEVMEQAYDFICERVRTIDPELTVERRD